MKNDDFHIFWKVSKIQLSFFFFGTRVFWMVPNFLSKLVFRFISLMTISLRDICYAFSFHLFLAGCQNPPFPGNLKYTWIIHEYLLNGQFFLFLFLHFLSKTKRINYTLASRNILVQWIRKELLDTFKIIKMWSFKKKKVVRFSLWVEIESRVEIERFVLEQYKPNQLFSSLWCFDFDQYLKSFTNNLFHVK